MIGALIFDVEASLPRPNCSMLPAPGVMALAADDLVGQFRAQPEFSNIWQGEVEIGEANCGRAVCDRRHTFLLVQPTARHSSSLGKAPHEGVASRKGELANVKYLK